MCFKMNLFVFVFGLGFMVFTESEDLCLSSVPENSLVLLLEFSTIAINSLSSLIFTLFL